MATLSPPAAGHRTAGRHLGMDSERPPHNGRSPGVSATIVATLANDLRNLLAVMVTSIDAIHRSVPPEPEVERTFAELNSAVDGAFRVSHDLVALVQPPRAELAVAELNEVVSQSQRVIERLVGEHVRVSVNSTPFNTVVRAAAIEVEWLLLNLALNAADSMPGGGLLTIETDLIRVPPDLTKSYGRLTMTDTGAGMNSQVRSRAIEPFFSTRSGAFGLGLTSAALIVRRLGGFLRLAVTGPQGTSLEVYLPAHSSSDERNA